jgi:hypothetical protein
MPKGAQAIEGALRRTKDLPANDLSNEAYQASQTKGWDDQWYNWDDLGGSDPGWGDVGS